MKPRNSIVENELFKRLGMALINAQRVEFVTGEMLKYLAELDEEFFGITTEDFLTQSKKSIRPKMTLGNIFTLLKLNPKLVVVEKLDVYLQDRNILAHSFWKDYLITNAPISSAINFLVNFGKASVEMESFFKGLIYYLSLRFIPNSSYQVTDIKMYEPDFEKFLDTLVERGVDLPIKKVQLNKEH